MPRFLSTLLLSSVLLSACAGGGASRADNAAKAMAETACLLFDNGTALEDIEQKTNEIIANYGFTSTDEIDSYLAEIQGTEELNELSVTLRTHLETTCGEALAANDVNAASLAEAMVLE